VKKQDNTIQDKNDALRRADDALRLADQNLRLAKDALRRADQIFLETVARLNTELFVANGKLTLRAALEDVEKKYVAEPLEPKKGQSMRDCVWTWLLTHSARVKGAFRIENEKDVLKWVEVAKSMYKHGKPQGWLIRPTLG
jgi:hypothetical protein